MQHQRHDYMNIQENIDPRLASAIQDVLLDVIDSTENLPPQAASKLALLSKMISDKTHQTKIPLSEPVFLIRAKDTTTVATLEFYAAELYRRGCRGDIHKNVIKAIWNFKQWQKTNTVKLPDYNEPTVEDIPEVG